MPHLDMVIRGFLFLLIFAKKKNKQTNKNKNENYPVFYYFNYYSAAYPSFTNTPGRLQNKP